MRVYGSFRPAMAGILFLLSAAAGAQGLTILNAVTPGEWQLHEVGTTGAARSLCVSDPALLLQLQHGSSACTRAVLTDGPKSATVRYTCRGLGNGLTTLSIESSSLIRVHTQGIIRGAPFDVDYEGRRQGPCART